MHNAVSMSCYAFILHTTLHFPAGTCPHRAITSHNNWLIFDSQVPKGSECVEFNQSFASCLNAHPEAIAGLKSAAEGGLNLGFPEPPPGMHYHNHYHHPPPRHQPPHK